MIDIYCHCPVFTSSFYRVFKLTRMKSGQLIWKREYSLYVLEEILDLYPNSFLLEGVMERSPITGIFNMPYWEGDLA